MSDLQKLIAETLATVTNEVALELVEAREQGEIIVLNGEHHLMEQQKKQEMKIDEEEEQLYQLELNAFKVKLRNQLLAEKQRVFTECFAAAEAQMNQWNQAEFQRFMEDVLAYLEPTAPTEVLLGEKSKDLVSLEWFQQSKWQLTLSEEELPNKAGFILRVAGIDYNFLFESLLNEQKEALIPMLAENLFP